MNADQGSSPADRRSTLRAALTRQGPVVAVGVCDPLSARIAERAGAEALYVGSYGIATATYGVPDIGLLGLSDIVDAVRRISSVTTVPLVVDGEGGFGTAFSVVRTIVELERAGASAVHLEDHVTGKHTSLPVELTSPEVMAKRVRLAVRARADRNLIVIARTDALNAGGSSSDATERLEAYEQAGADAVMVAGCTPSVLADIRHRFRTPVVITNSPGWTREQEADAGVNLVLHYGFSVLVSAEALRQQVHRLLNDPDAYRDQPWTAMGEELDDLTGLPWWLSAIDDSGHG